MIPTYFTKHYLIAFIAFIVIFISYKAILLFLTLLITLLFGFFLYLDQQLPDIEKDYDIFTNFDRPIHFLGSESENCLSKLLHDSLPKTALVKNFEMNRKITDNENLDAKLNELMQLVFKDYVNSWNYSVSLSNDFPSKLYIFINYTVTSFFQRFKTVNACSFISNKVLDSFIKHHRIYRFTKNTVHPDQTDNFQTKFFENELKIDGPFSREQLCKSRPKLTLFWDQIFDILQYLLYPYSNFNQPTFRSLTKGILIQTVLLPVLELLSSSDFINKFLISLCKTNLPNPDTFINHLQYAISVEELKAILKSIDEEILLVRSKDHDSDETKMKQQLGSLQYLKKIVVTMIDKFDYENLSLNEDDHECNFDNDPEINSAMVHGLNFDSILKNNIALEYFIDFLLQDNLSIYINFFINVESYKITLEQTHFELYLLGIQNGQIENLDKATEERQMHLYQTVREAAMNIFETYISPISINRLELVNEIYCDKVRDHLSSNDPQNWMNETLFDELFSNVRQIITTNPKFLPAFKRDRNSMKRLSQTDFVNEFSTKNGSSQKLNDSPDSDKQHDSNDSNKYALVPGFITEITETGLLKDHGKPFVAYLIQIVKPNDEKWIILRRYSEFYEFHQFIAIKCQRIHYNLKAVLSLPPKTVLHNRLNPKFIEHRKNQLNLYLKRMYFVYERFPFLRSDIECFLHPNTNYFGPNHTVTNQSSNESNSSHHESESNIFNPFKVLGNVVKNGSENILDSFQKFGRSLTLQPETRKLNPLHPPPSPTVTHRERSSSIHDNDSKASLLDAYDRKSLESESFEENIPILYVLDELFDLKSQNFWLRRRLIDIFKQIIEVTYSDMINKKISEYIENLTSFEAFGEYFTMIKDSLWDSNGELRDPIEPKIEEIFRRQFAARSLILSNFTDLRKVIGNETVQNGLLNFVNLFQNDTINQRFVLVLFELLIKETFPDNYFDEIFHRLHRSNQKNNLKQNETKNAHQNIKTEWPPHLCKFVAKI